jgi:heptosyltransferase I
MPYTPPSFSSPPQRILLIKPSAIGDVVHALPVLNLLRRCWPEAHISWLITPACAGLIEGHPQLNELILFDRKRFANSWRSIRSFKEFRRFNRSLRDHRFDLVIDLQGLFRSGWLAWHTHAPVRVGSTDVREFGGIFCTHLAPAAPRPRHAVDRYLAVADFLGLGTTPVEFIFPTDDNDRRFVEGLIPRDMRFAVLLPTTNWETKRWPVGSFAALVQPLRERFGLQSVLAGGSDAVALSGQLPDVINLAGKTNLRQLVALLERAELVIGPDTGPMHIASALGRPLVTMFGPTSPLETGPYLRSESVLQLDIPCHGCYSRTCSHQSCLRWLGIEPVLKLAAEQMGKSQRSTHSLSVGH